MALASWRGDAEIEGESSRSRAGRGGDLCMARSSCVFVSGGCWAVDSRGAMMGVLRCGE